MHTSLGLVHESNNDVGCLETLKLALNAIFESVSMTVQSVEAFVSQLL